MRIQVSASIMAGNFTQEAVNKAQCTDKIHIDIMDGQFVKKKTIGPEEVAKLESRKPKDVHLMVKEPKKDIEMYVEAGVSRISFHPEVTKYPEEIINQIKTLGVKAGIAIDSNIPIEDVFELLYLVNFVIVMSVKAGEGGQDFIPETLNKIQFIRNNFPEMDIEIDGGINKKTAKLAIEAGANILISGSWLFKDIEENTKTLKNLN